MKKYMYVLLGTILCGCSNEPIIEPEDSAYNKEQTEESEKGGGNENGEEVEYPVITSIKLTTEEKSVVSTYNNFAWKMVEQINVSDKNVVFSPLSASLALSMLATGAEGETQTEIFQTIGLDVQSILDINSCCKILTEQLAMVDTSVDFTSVGSLWYDNGFKIKDAYKSNLRTYYASDAFKINRATFVEDVNLWCAEQTNGMIDKMLNKDDLVDDLLQLFIVNAIYFKGGWCEDYKFDETETAKSAFYNYNGNVKDAEFMNNKHSYLYVNENGLRTATIPFGGEAFRFTIILPDESSNVEECLATLHSGVWQTIENNRIGKNLEMKLPKFDVENMLSLKDVLTKLGIEKAFTTSAEFCGITEQSTFVNNVKQGVHFKIDEEGAEAAAVTTIGACGSTGEDAKPVYEPFYVDRPFLFVLSERSSGAILFVGKIVDL